MLSSNARPFATERLRRLWVRRSLELFLFLIFWDYLKLFLFVLLIIWFIFAIVKRQWNTWPKYRYQNKVPMNILRFERKNISTWSTKFCNLGAGIVKNTKFGAICWGSSCWELFWTSYAECSYAEDEVTEWWAYQSYVEQYIWYRHRNHPRPSFKIIKHFFFVTDAVVK
jgi:hypothetical protein